MKKPLKPYSLAPGIKVEAYKGLTATEGVEFLSNGTERVVTTAPNGERLVVATRPRLSLVPKFTSE